MDKVSEEALKEAEKWWNELIAKSAYIHRIRRTGYPMDQYFRRSAKYEGHPVMTRRP